MRPPTIDFSCEFRPTCFACVLGLCTLINPQVAASMCAATSALGFGDHAVEDTYEEGIVTAE
jgi:hypothetical protein